MLTKKDTEKCFPYPPPEPTINSSSLALRMRSDSAVHS